MEHIKVKGESDLVRDPRTNAIVNTNHNEYNKYIEMRNKKLSEVKRVEDIESEVKEIKNDLNEIKSLLLDLARKQD